MTTECDAMDCESNTDGLCTNCNLKIKNGQCISGKTNMDYLHKLWSWEPGKELVKQRMNQSEFSKSMEENKQ